MATRCVQLVANQAYREIRGSVQAVQPHRDLGPSRAWIVDARPDRNEVAGGSQLIEERARDAQPGSDPLGRRRRHTALAEHCKQLIHPLAHDRVECRGAVRQAHPVAFAAQCT